MSRRQLLAPAADSVGQLRRASVQVRFEVAALQAYVPVLIQEIRPHEEADAFQGIGERTSERFPQEAQFNRYRPVHRNTLRDAIQPPLSERPELRRVEVCQALEAGAAAAAHQRRVSGVIDSRLVRYRRSA